MARTPLLQLSGISLTFGGNPIFSDLDLVVQPGDRIALVGRNGTGKSTLMKIMAGLAEPDTGERTLAPATSVGYMEQDPDLSAFETLGAFAASNLAPGEEYRVEMFAEGLKFNSDTPVATASGGEKRRAALAKLLAEGPELMLLDEPTNHLDIEAIAWLEDELSSGRQAFVLISHDRAFLRKLSRATLWIDRGQVRRQDKGFEHFEAWREKLWEEEDQARHKLDRKIKAEARWAVEGISARRKRNQGRVRALADLRENRAAMIRRQGTADMALEAGSRSGRMVIDAKGLTKTFGKPIVQDFDLRVMRGDRVAFVGPNGVGKTTLLKILMGEMQPDAGSIRHGTNLMPVTYDQNRTQLDPEATLWDSLASDPALGVSGKADQVMVRGNPKHVVAYLKDFLFDERQVRAPVRSLSGGEKARLLLARLMARESNVLILDEPTNDLDIETLDLLQELIADYDGTVLLVSHDRDFLDRVATITIAMEGDGQARAYPGGWSDYRRQRGNVAPTDSGADSPGKSPAKPSGKPSGILSGSGGGASNSTGNSSTSTASKPASGGALSYVEQHRLTELPAKIARLEAEIAKLEEFLADPTLFTRAPAKFKKATEGLAQRQAALAKVEEDWLALEERASQAG